VLGFTQWCSPDFSGEKLCGGLKVEPPDAGGHWGGLGRIVPTAAEGKGDWSGVPALRDFCKFLIKKRIFMHISAKIVILK